MDYSESNTQAGEFLRLTLGFLAKHNLPATPVNYTVWYEYASGKNPKLRKAIDQMLEKKLSLNKNQVEGLYQKFISDGDRVVISRLLTKLNLMLREITMYVVETEGDLSAHGQTLDNLSDQIEDIHDFDGVEKGHRPDAGHNQSHYPVRVTPANPDEGFFRGPKAAPQRT